MRASGGVSDAGWRASGPLVSGHGGRAGVYCETGFMARPPWWGRGRDGCHGDVPGSSSPISHHVDHATCGN